MTKQEQRKHRASMDTMVRFFDDCLIDLDPETATLEQFAEADWLWRGYRGPHGTPRIYLPGNTTQTAKQWIYKQLYPEVIAKPQRNLLVTCLEKWECVSPFHMEQSSSNTNNKRAKKLTELEYPGSYPRPKLLFHVWREYALQAERTRRDRAKERQSSQA